MLSTWNLVLSELAPLQLESKITGLRVQVRSSPPTNHLPRNPCTLFSLPAHHRELELAGRFRTTLLCVALHRATTRERVSPAECAARAPLFFFLIQDYFMCGARHFISSPQVDDHVEEKDSLLTKVRILGSEDAGVDAVEAGPSPPPLAPDPSPPPPPPRSKFEYKVRRCRLTSG